MNKHKKHKTNKQIKKDQGLVRWVGAHKEIFLSILGIATTLYPITNTIYKIVYKRSCEVFYGIPGKYFDSNIDTRLLYLGFILVAIFACVVPMLMKKNSQLKKSKGKKHIIEFELALLAIGIGLTLGLLNVFNLVDIIKQTYNVNRFTMLICVWMGNHAYFTVWTVSVCGVFSVLGITFADTLVKIKRKFVYTILCMIVTVALLGSILMMLVGTMIKLSISIEDKTRYEFVIYDKEYVVLSSSGDKILVVPFQIDNNGGYIFNTKEYMFKDSYSGVYEYKNIERCPKIVKNAN